MTSSRSLRTFKIERRVLLVYGREPSGHSSAAAAIEMAGRKAGLSFCSVEVANEPHPFLGKTVATGYMALLAAVPSVWGRAYRSAQTQAILRRVRSLYLCLGGGEKILDTVRRERAEAIVCPQASIAAVLSEARQREIIDCPVVSVMTDFGAHPFWTDPIPDLICASSSEAARELENRGVPHERVMVTGIPVHPVFSAKHDRSHARSVLGLASDTPVILLTGGSKGLGTLRSLSVALLCACPQATILVLCGVNERLARLTRRAFCESRRVHIFGTQSAAMVAVLMAAADLHVGKPGGLMAAESMALGLPMILCGTLPGQEEENASYLERIGVALGCSSPKEAVSIAARLIADRGRLHALRAHALLNARPSAAAAVISRVDAAISKRIDSIDRPRQDLLKSFR